MKTQIVPFIGGSYEYRSRGVSVQKTLNLYPEKIESAEGKTQYSLVHTEGTELLAEIGPDSTAACRGFWFSSTGPDNQQKLYGAFGNTIYRINADYSFVKIGEIATGTGPIGIADNGFSLVVADGVALYEADLSAADYLISSTWKQVNLPYLAGTTEPIRPSQVFFLNQRLVINSQRGEFYFSNLASTEFFANGDVNQPNFYSAESSADAINSMVVVGNRLWLFGERSFEVWSSSGTTDSDPFSFIQGSASQVGCQSPRSVATIGENVFFLGSSAAGRNTIFMASGMNTPVRISTNAIEHELATILDPQGSVGWCYYNEGHTFYVLTFIASARTFVFDVSTGLWHERSTRNWNTTKDEAWEALFGVTAYNKVINGSSTSNRLIKLDSTKYTDFDGREIVRQRIGPVYYSDLKSITCREIQVDMEVGTTPLLAGLGRDPQAILEVSKDGGNSWVNFDWRSIGKQGDYHRIVKWSNIGAGHSIIAKLTFSDPSPITIYGMRISFQESSRR